MAMCLLSVPALSQGVPPDPLDSGLVLSLDFNGNLLDTSGAGNSPLLTAIPFTNNPAGEPLSAAHFDGSSQFLLVKDAPSLHTPFMTVAFWMRSDAIQIMQMAVKAHYGDAFGEQWSIYYDTFNYSRPSLVYAIKRNGTGRGLGWNNLPFAGVQLTNQWLYVAVTWDGTNQNLYLDGRLAARKTDTPAGGIDEAPLGGDIMISKSVGPDYLYNGDMDQFRIYNRALAPAEILALYLRGGGALKYEVALATGQVVNGFFVQVNLVKGGFGYTNTPKVRIVGGGGTGAVAVANITDLSVSSITVLNPGSGYTNTPAIWIDAPIPIGASATAVVNSGGITSVNVDYPGFGYTNKPIISLVGGGGSGAEVEPIIVDGLIVGFSIVKPGQGYTSAPFVRIDPPASVQIPPASLDVGVKSIQITLHVVQSHRYVLDGTSDFVNWLQLGDAFDAVSSSVVKVFDVSDAPGFFRLRDITYNP